MAERYGSLLRRVLACADFFNDRAIFAGSFQVNTPRSRSSALLRRVTLADHFFVDFATKLPADVSSAARRLQTTDPGTLVARRGPKADSRLATDVSPDSYSSGTAHCSALFPAGL